MITANKNISLSKLTKLALFFLFFPSCNLLTAQRLFPNDNDTLNFTQFYFELPFHSKAKIYSIEISTSDSFIKSIETTKPYYFIKNLKPATSYKWRYASSIKNEKKSWSCWHYFTIKNFKILDKDKFKLSSMPTPLTKDTFCFFVDGLQSIIDQNLNVIWEYPYPTEDKADTKSFRDFRVSPFGTITFLNGNIGEELDLKGRLIWKTPHENGVSYHHDFKTLQNGSRVLLVEKLFLFNVQDKLGDATIDKTDYNYVRKNDVLFVNINLGLIREFNTEGEMIWERNFFDVLDTSYLFCTLNKKSKLPSGSAHSNSFDWDESNNDIYLNFRDISLIVKINKLDTTVTSILKTTDCQNEYICCAHDIHLNNNLKQLLLFNNRSCGEFITPLFEHAPPTIVLLDLLDLTKSKSIPIGNINQNVGSMGGVEQTINNSFLVNMGVDNHLYLIDSLGNLKWQLELQQFQKNKWEPIKSYRANLVKSLFPDYMYIQRNGNELYISNESDLLKKIDCIITDLDSTNLETLNLIIEPHSQKVITIPSDKKIKLHYLFPNRLLKEEF